MTRKGKIARLPLGVRRELNRRIENGEEGKGLVAWLNGHPDVKWVLAAMFEGRAINEQNLSEWKAGGYRDWLAQEAERERVRELTEQVEELAEAGSTYKGLANSLAGVLVIRYAEVLAEWKGEVTDEFERKLNVLRKLRMDVVALRRSDLSATRLELEQSRYDEAMDLKADERRKKKEVKLRMEAWEAEYYRRRAAEREPKQEAIKAGPAEMTPPPPAPEEAREREEPTPDLPPAHADEGEGKMRDLKPESDGASRPGKGAEAQRATDDKEVTERPAGKGLKKPGKAEPIKSNQTKSRQIKVAEKIEGGG